MTRPLLIKAAMRSADVGHLADQIQRLEQGGIDALHFDVMDGRFVPEICMGPSFIRGLRKYTALPFEVHLLLQGPNGCVAQYLDAGADCLLIHVEASADPTALLEHVHRQGRRAGLAITPATPSGVLEPHLQACDVLNVMTVAPGQPGVLHEGGVRNLSAVAEMVQRHRRTLLVQADGAVSLATRQRLLDAGAQALVAGYPVFSREDFGPSIAELRYGHQRTAAYSTGGSDDAG